MLDFNVENLSNEELRKLRDDADRIVEARCYNAAHKLKIGSLVICKQLDGSSHNYLIVDYDKIFDNYNVSYSLKVLHYYTSPIGKITGLSINTINEHYAAIRLKLLDPRTVITETGLKEGEYQKKLNALHMEIIEEFAMDGDK